MVTIDAGQAFGYYQIGRSGTSGAGIKLRMSGGQDSAIRLAVSQDSNVSSANRSIVSGN
jgi:hypothetical protein